MNLQCSTRALLVDAENMSYFFTLNFVAAETVEGVTCTFYNNHMVPQIGILKHVITSKFNTSSCHVLAMSPGGALLLHLAVSKWFEWPHCVGWTVNTPDSLLCAHWPPQVRGASVLVDVGSSVSFVVTSFSKP